MNTQSIVEALLYISPNIEKFLKAAHVIDNDRRWKAKKHDEFYFLPKFCDPHFIVLINNRIHVYIIGDKDKGKSYNVLNIEGFNTDHMVITKGELKTHIKNIVDDEEKFLPINFSNRIIYMHQEKLFIFNQLNNIGKKMMSSTKTYWQLGTNIYDVEAKSYNTSSWAIINAMLSEF